MFAASQKRPFELIAQAEEAWHQSDLSRAEALFREGVSAYRRDEPDGLDFALGRFGAFLLDGDRVEEAANVLQQAIDRGTDLPAIWSDYARIVADRHDAEAFKHIVQRMAASTKSRPEPEFVLAHARRAHREGATAFAHEITQWVIDKSACEGDTEGRWTAVGDFGRFLEREGQLEGALHVWREAFRDGSGDPQTIDRLSMHLEHAKDCPGAAAVIREALQRGLPANTEEGLRKRLARCEAKADGRPTPRGGKRPDVAAYSIRQPSSSIIPVFQVRIKPSVRNIAVIGNVGRCLAVSNGSSTLVDIDLRNGSELRRVENLPEIGEMYSSPGGEGIGVRRTAAVGRGPTFLTFWDANGHVVANSSVPDATSNIAQGAGLWYVGCRNGLLYGYGFDGVQRWTWETPGASSSTDNVYFRPCPYYVASSQSFAAVASMGNIYAVSPNGKMLWHAVLPNEHQTRWEFTVPIPGVRASHEPYGILGLSRGATRDRVKSAYRRLALATHPDRNPSDTESTTNFRRVQEAYERILTGDVDLSEPVNGITIRMEVSSMGPLASFLLANEAAVIAGSSQGRIYSFEANGRLREARIIGDGQVRVALRPNGSIGAAWCDNALVFFQESNIVNAVEAVDWPNALTMFGDDVVLWRRNEIQLLDSYGRSIWGVEFSKSVGTVVARGDTLICAAGALAGFRRAAS